MASLSLVIQRGMRVTPVGFCLRVIVNKGHIYISNNYVNFQVSKKNFFKSFVSDEGKRTK